MLPWFVKFAPVMHFVNDVWRASRDARSNASPANDLGLGRSVKDLSNFLQGPALGLGKDEPDDEDEADQTANVHLQVDVSCAATLYRLSTLTK